MNAKQGLSQLDYFKITILGFGLTALWAAMHGIILPLRLLDFVPAAQKNTYLDLMILVGLLLAVITQPVVGAISDRSRFAWGRRRPFIFAGVLFLLLLMPGIALSTGYAAIFTVYCLMQVAANSAQGPFQAFIPDMVREERRGTASGWRGLINLLGGVILIRLTAPYMDRYLLQDEESGLWLALGLMGAILVIVTAVTLLTVRERPSENGRPRPGLRAFYRSFRVDTSRHPTFIIFLFACLLMFSAWGLLTGHALYFLTDVMEMDGPVTMTGNLLLAVGGSLLPAVYPAGRLCDKVGRKPMGMASGLLGALGVISLYFSAFHSQSEAALMFSGVLLGSGAGVWVSTQWALATDLVGRGDEARLMGLVNISVAGAGGISRLSGPAIDHFNASGPNLGYEAMLLACLVFFIAGSLLLLKTRVTFVASS